MSAAHVWLNTDTAAVYIGAPSRDAFRKWAKRHGVVCCRRGRRIVVARRDLDRALGADVLQRHGEPSLPAPE